MLFEHRVWFLEQREDASGGGLGADHGGDEERRVMSPIASLGDASLHAGPSV